MLSLDATIGPINGLTIFRDHADPDRFHYISERPRLSRAEDGRPEFVFLLYSRDVTDNPNLSADEKTALGGGFLAFTVDLTVPEPVLADTRRKLGPFAQGTPELGPVLFRKGSVRLSIAKDVADAEGATADTPRGESFFEEVYGTSKPSLLGENRATFGVVLDHEGALLMEAGLRSGISPIGVIYDLEYLGLRPAFDVKIRADYKRIYSHLETSFGVRGGVGPIALAANVDLAWQELRDNGSITVEVVTFTDDESFRKQADAAFDWFKTELLRDFFKSSLEPPSFMRQGQGQGVLGALQTLIGPLVAGQQGTPTPTYGVPSPLAPTPAAPPTSPDSGVASTADRNRAATAGRPAATGARPPAGGLDLGIQLGFSLKKIEQTELKVREFAYSLQAAVAREAAPQGMFSTLAGGLDLDRAIKRVKLDDEFFTRVKATFTLGADLEKAGIGAVTVNVEYPADRPAGTPPEHVEGFTWTPTDKDPKTFLTGLNAARDRSYRYRIDAAFGPGSEWVGNEPTYRSDWVTTTAEDVIVDPFYALDLLDVEITRPVASADVQQVQVELSYDDPVRGFRDDRTIVLDGAGSHHWRLRFAEGSAKVFRHRATYFLAGNVRHTTEWRDSPPITTEVASLVVNDPWQGRLDMRLVPMLDGAEFLDANVVLRYHEPDTGYEWRDTVTLPGGAVGRAPAQDVVVPTIAAAPAGLTVTTTVVRSDGSTFDGDPTPVAADRPILVTDGPGATKLVQVRLANPDLAGAGLAAVRVTVTGPGEGPDVAETLFVPEAATPRTVAIGHTEPGPVTVTYRVDGFTTAGLPVAGETGTTASTQLLVPLPA